jgi:hypothetical protein
MSTATHASRPAWGTWYNEQLTLYCFDPVMPGHEGWPLWLKLLDAGALVEV